MAAAAAGGGGAAEDEEVVVRAAKKPRVCGGCGKPGHRIDTCPNSKKAAIDGGDAPAKSPRVKSKERKIYTQADMDEVKRVMQRRIDHLEGKFEELTWGVINGGMLGGGGTTRFAGGGGGAARKFAQPKPSVKSYKPEVAVHLSHADRAEWWAAASPVERERFKELREKMKRDEEELPKRVAAQMKRKPIEEPEPVVEEPEPVDEDEEPVDEEEEEEEKPKPKIEKKKPIGKKK